MSAPLSDTERKRRSRAHQAGDHSLCDAMRCDGPGPRVPLPAAPPEPEPVAVPEPLVTVHLGALGDRDLAALADLLDRAGRHPRASRALGALLKHLGRQVERVRRGAAYEEVRRG